MKANAPPFRSLRARFLGVIVTAALLAAGLVGWLSYRLGDTWSQRDIDQRFAAIEETLSAANFPLNQTVLETVAELTQTDLVASDRSGETIYATLPIGNPQPDAKRTPGYRIRRFTTRETTTRSDRVATVEVWYDESQLEATRRRAALLPLFTGLSTILILSSLTVVFSSRLANRIGKLQQRVQRVAGGDFTSQASDRVNDEIGQLGSAVDSMSTQLQQLWKNLKRQQGEKLLHQIAGGMSHQLRNSLTGARMAVELHARECSHDDAEGLDIAIHQIEAAEEHVRRLLVVASGQTELPRPTRVGQCYRDLRDGLEPIIQHLRVQVNWQIEDAAESMTVQDGPSWVAATTNLVHNAIQAGDAITVSIHAVPVDLKSKGAVAGEIVRCTITDNGPGIEDEIADELFEPFVTSKPEGVGLGLAVAKRAADQLGGDLTWRRDGDVTVFQLDARTTADAEPPTKTANAEPPTKTTDQTKTENPSTTASDRS